jgi:hypothetical protein
MPTRTNSYAARLKIDYPDKLDRLTTFFRILWSIPILIVLALLNGPSGRAEEEASRNGWHMSDSTGGILSGLFVATALLIVFRQRYPRWWFDFVLELKRFSARVGAYLFLLTDRYPSTVEAQSVHLDIDYPDVEKNLNRYLPLVKWFLAIPHYIVLIVLLIVSVLATVIAWIAILFTGRYPRSLFDFVVGVGRWALRVDAYAFILVTDKYPPFSLK